MSNNISLSGEDNKTANYRSVSVTGIYSKLTERIVHSAFMNHIEQKLLSNATYRFRNIAIHSWHRPLVNLLFVKLSSTLQDSGAPRTTQ